MRREPVVGLIDLEREILSERNFTPFGGVTEMGTLCETDTLFTEATPRKGRGMGPGHGWGLMGVRPGLVSEGYRY